MKEGKKRGRSRKTWKDGIYTAMNERDLRMGEWNNRRQWNMKVGRRRQTSDTVWYNPGDDETNIVIHSFHYINLLAPEFYI